MQQAWSQQAWGTRNGRSIKKPRLVDWVHSRTPPLMHAATAWAAAAVVKQKQAVVLLPARHLPPACCNPVGCPSPRHPRPRSAATASQNMPRGMLSFTAHNRHELGLSCRTAALPGDEHSNTLEPKRHSCGTHGCHMSYPLAEETFPCRSGPNLSVKARQRKDR